MFTFNIHGQADDLSLLEPLVRHLGHVEIAIDYQGDAIDDINVREHSRQPHPVVAAIDEADRELRRIQAAQIKGGKTTYARKLEREVERKRKERQVQRELSPKVIKAVACPTCKALPGRPCRNPDNHSTEYGFTGHTHFARREAYRDGEYS